MPKITPATTLFGLQDQLQTGLLEIHYSKKEKMWAVTLYLGEGDATCKAPTLWDALDKALSSKLDFSTNSRGD